ncbi:YcaO-like family protein [Sedimentitalea sp. XS_ASV28]|uniref:YcaO-like family protein n=1 Tax=Sedimentitalea sp. XS_ASV28 TaxID=3241296 RepID=UPI0035152044
MFTGPLPDVPALFVHGSVSARNGTRISATGIGDSAAQARLRHDAERAERMAIAGARHGTPPADPRSGPRLQGIAAGRDPVQAIQQRALLELIERYACLSWWNGTLAANAPARETLDAFDAARQRWPRNVPRRTGLLQPDLPGLPPTCIAWSCESPGLSLCFGTACRMDGPTAAVAALRELYQMEFGLSVIRHRQANGLVLTAPERAILDRAQSLSVSSLLAHLRPAGQAANRFAGNLRSALADAGIPVASEQLDQTMDGHRVVIVTAYQPTAVSSVGKGCETAMRWNLYGA